MQRLFKSLTPLFFLCVAIALYSMGFAAESAMVVFLAMAFEGVFWVKLFKKNK